MPLATVLQAVDTHLDSLGDSISTEPDRADPALRERCARIISKISGVASLGSELTRLFEQYETIADAFESARSALHETRGRLAEEGDAHAILKNRFAALERELVLEKSEMAALRAQIDHLAITGSELEQHVHALQTDLQHARGIIQDGDKQSAARLAEIAALTEELHTAKQDVLRAEIAAVALRVELSSALAHASNVEAANSALQVALSDSRHGTEQLAESLDEARHELQRSQARVHELEQQYEIQAGEHHQANAGMISQVEDQRAEMAALNVQVVVLGARLEAADRLLKDVPVLMERAAAWEQKVTALEAENADMRAQAAEFEEIQQAVAERAHALVNAIKAKDKESSQTKASLVNLSARLERETKRFEAERERLEAVIADLRQELDAKHSRRSGSQPADIAMANGVTMASAAVAANTDKSAKTPAPLPEGEDVERAPLEAERERLEAVIADLRRELDAERSRRTGSQPAETAMADAVAMASAPAAGNPDNGATTPEPLPEGEEAKPAPQKFTVEERQKPNSAGGRKRRPRHRESSRHISRH